MIKKAILFGSIALFPLLTYSQDTSYFTWGSVAVGNHINGLDNPAHMMTDDEVDKAAFYVNAYGHLSDPDDVIHQAEALEELIKDFENLLAQGIATYGDGIELLNDLQNAKGSQTKFFGGGEFLFTMPNLFNPPFGGSVPLAIFGKNTSRAAAELYYDPQDANRVVSTIANQRIADSGASVSNDIKQGMDNDIMALDLDPSKGLVPLMTGLKIIADKYLPGSGILESTDIPSSLNYDELTFNLLSEGRLDAYMISEFGIMSGYHFDAANLLYSPEIGIAFKYQDIWLFQVREKVSSFNNYSFDRHKYRTTASHINVDLGAKVRFGYQGQYHIGITAQNLIPKDIEGKQGSVLKLRPQVTLGLGYEWRWLAASLDVELLRNPEFGIVEPSQYADLSFAFKPEMMKFATFRTGYRHDIQGSDDGVFSAGFSLKPWGEKFIFDVDGLYSGENSYGVQVGLGVNF